MKINMKFSFIIIILVFLLSGCYSYTTYSGYYYFSNKSKFISISDQDLNKIEMIFRSIANSFGFKEDRSITRNYISFYRSRKEALPTKYKYFKGADSHIILTFSKDNPFITLRDLNSTEETEFVYTLKKEIEKQVGKVIDFSSVKFER